MVVGDVRTYEVTFCSRVSRRADSLFSENPSWNFSRTEIEESKGIKRKRSDLRIYGRPNRERKQKASVSQEAETAS
jgi:hypothetical protein